MKQKSAIFLLVCCLLFCNCEKQNTYTHLSPALLSAFNYQMGSCWIYKDSLTGEIDSMYVSGHDSGAAQSYSNLSNYNDQIDIYIDVVHDNSAFNETWWITLRSNEIAFYKFHSDIYGVENKLTFPAVAYPFIDTNILANGDTGYVSVQPVYTLSGLQYNNVGFLNFSNTYQYPIALFHDLFYLEPKVGVLKFVFNHPTDSVHRVMELQRYHIVL